MLCKGIPSQICAEAYMNLGESLRLGQILSEIASNHPPLFVN